MPETAPTDPQIALLAEQLRRTIDLLRGELHALQRSQANDAALAAHRLAQLEAQAKDHEDRLRSVQDSATQFKVLAGLATGGGLLSLISLLKVLLT